MLKNKFIKSTIILIIGGLISKLLAMIIRIILNRKIGPDGLGLYMLVLPTFQLFITLANLGGPTAISKLVSEQKKNNKKLVLSLIPSIIIFNILLMLLLFLIAPFISKYGLNNNKTLYPLISIGLTLPFITISDIIRGYFFGKQKTFPYVFSNIVEQIIRLLLTAFVIPKLLVYSIEITVTGVVLINVISEFSSILVLMIFVPKNVNIKKEDFKYNKAYLKDTLAIGIPTTSSRLIGSIGSFLEPILLTTILLKLGSTKEFITFQYGIINGYILPLLLLPSFFTFAISNALLPVISNNYVNNNFKEVKRKIKQAITLSLLVGIPSTLIFIFFPENIEYLLYKTTLGSDYLKIIAPFFLFHYIQSPLTATLNGMGKAKCAMRGTIIGTLLRILSLIICLYLNLKLWSILISLILNILAVTIHHLYYIKKYLK